MIKAALIDMDGVLYDSMKYHTLAWHKVMRREGIDCTRDEFYLYEGMTGIDTINHLFMREFGRECEAERAQKIYNEKSELFRRLGERVPMTGALRLLTKLKDAGVRCILVTGSSQDSLLNSLSSDFPGIFAPGDRVTGRDVTHGKPHPEPYLRGLALAGVAAKDAIVIENAPLGVRAGKSAGIFTIAVTTGPIPIVNFEEENADVIFSSMEEASDKINDILKVHLPS